MEHAENIFERGCLIQLSVKVYNAWKGIPKKLLPEDSEWIKRRKKLLDDKMFKEANRMRSDARSYLRAMSLPFPIKGLVFVPKESIEIIDDRMTEFKKEFQDHLDQNIVPNYQGLKEEAYRELSPNGFYNEMDYPMDIRSKFSFEWRFVIIDTPGNGTRLLSPELYEREREKFINTMEQAQEMAISALRFEFADMVDHLIERLTPSTDGKTKRIHSSVIGNFEDFFNTFKQRNIWQDSDLAELVNKAENLIVGCDLDKLKKDEFVKKETKGAFEQIQKVVDKNLVDRPTRKIKL